MPTIRLLREHLDAMIAHAREVAPAECCGLIGGGSDQNAVTIYRLRNVTANPELAYEAAPADLFAAQRRRISSSTGKWSPMGSILPA